MTAMMLLACSTTEPQQTDDSGEAEPTPELFALDAIAGCATLRIIYDGWNTGSRDYIETVQFDEAGHWTEYSFYAPYHGDEEPSWYEYRTLSAMGHVETWSVDDLADDDDLEIVFERDEWGRVLSEVATSPQEVRRNEYTATYTYDGDIAAYQAAASARMPIDVLFPYDGASRTDIDVKSDGDVDEFVEYVWNDDWTLASRIVDDDGGGQPERTCSYDWTDQQLDHITCDSSDGVWELWYVYEDGRYVRADVTNTDTSKWQEYTVTYNWTCD